MDIQKKLELIAETIETDINNISPEKMLDDIQEWDSMARVSLIVMLDEEFEKQITANELKQLKTVQDIIDIMN